jgi:hypothetical protein
MLAVMGQSADRLFSTVNQQLLRVFAAAEASAAAGGGQPPSRGAKYALNVMLQGMNVPSIAAGLTQVRWPLMGHSFQAASKPWLRASPASWACRPLGNVRDVSRWWRLGGWGCLLVGILCVPARRPAAHVPTAGASSSPSPHLALHSFPSPPLPWSLPPPFPFQATLRDSISLLLLRLLDDGGLLHYEEGATLVKAVNVLMLKILEARWGGACAEFGMMRSGRAMRGRCCWDGGRGGVGGSTAWPMAKALLIREAGLGASQGGCQSLRKLHAGGCFQVLQLFFVRCRAPGWVLSSLVLLTSAFVGLPAHL